MADKETETHLIGVRKIIRKGASKAVTLPFEVVEILKLKDEIAFIQEGERVYLADSERVSKLYSAANTVITLGTPFTKEELEKLLKKKE